MMRTPKQDIAACRAFALQLEGFTVASVLIDAADQIERLALAAGSGTAETSETSAQGEASQSGGEAVTPKGQPHE